jgi:hypothetical protein
MLKKKSQVWIETVIYTLIGLTIIGLLLSFARPKIEEIRDRTIIEQSIHSLEQIDKTVSDIIVAPGNVRIVSYSLQKGNIILNPEQDKIVFVLNETEYIYSEPGKEILIGKLSLGELKAITTGDSESSDTSIWIDYKGSINLTLKNPEKRVIQKSSSPYRISFSNKGIQNGFNIIEIDVQ